MSLFVTGLTAAEIQKKFPKAEVVEVSTRAEGVKDLPRMTNGSIAPTFIANGNRYTILNPEDGIGITRYTELQKMIIPAQHGFNSFVEMYNYWEVEGAKLMTVSGEGQVKIGYADMVNNFKRNVSKMDNDRFVQAVQICSVFIVAEGENTAKFSHSEAQRKMEDWATENFNVFDFFVLALGRLKDYSDVYSAEYKKLTKAEQEKQSKAATGLLTVLTGGKK